MIKAAVVRWYLYALYLRCRRFRDRWLRPRAISESNDTLARLLFAAYEPIGAGAEEIGYRKLLRNREFKVSSQGGEDGLIAFIFSEIGVTDRRFVEFGVGDGRECMCANLAIWFGWSGLMLESDAAAAKAAYEHYADLERPGSDVQVRQAHVTAENINEVIAETGIEGEIDLLSVDIDGNDYWLWEAMHVVRPRVVVIEYNASLGLRPVTVPYDPGFVRWRKHPSGWYHGASLSALARLGARRGYDLVGTDSGGVNAFFVRRDALAGRLRALTPEAAYRPQGKRSAVVTTDRQFAAIEHLEYVHV